jgi:hypothetical protein
MQSAETSYERILDEDLQIVRATVAVISDDVRHRSARAAEDLQEALKYLDDARREFQRAGTRARPAS